VIVLLAIFAYIGIPGAVVLCDMLVLIGAFAIRDLSRLSQPARFASRQGRGSKRPGLGFRHTGNGAFDVRRRGRLARDVRRRFVCRCRCDFARAGGGGGRGIAILPFQSVAAEPHTTLLARAPGFALEAIEASHQGIFDLDFAGDMLSLSHDAAALVGLPDANSTLRHADWLARVHDADREVYREALIDYRNRPGLSFRVESACAGTPHDFLARTARHDAGRR